MKKTIILLFFLVFLLAAKAQESQSIYSVLRLPVSAHAAALGGENVSLIEDDATLVTHNPALLQSVSDRSLTLGYMNYMKGSNLFSAGYAFLVNDKATVAVNALYLDYGKMKHTNSIGQVLGDFNASDMVLSGTLSYTLANRLVGGVTARFVYSTIDTYHSVGAVADLGLNYYNEESDLSLSLVAKSLGGQLSAYDDDFESVPGDLQMGVTKGFSGSPFRVSVTATDLTRWNYAFLQHLILGAELRLSDQFYIAAGYSPRRAKEMKVKADDDMGDGKEKSGLSGLSIGAGLMLDRFKLNVSYGKYHVSSSSLMVNIGITM